MIRHLVLFSARNPGDADAIIEALGALGDIPEAKQFEVARNEKLDDASAEIDVVLHAVFESREALERFKNHDAYAATTARVRPMRELRFVADYETP